MIYIYMGGHFGSSCGVFGPLSLFSFYCGDFAQCMVFSRTFAQPGLVTFTLTRHLPPVTLLEATFFQFTAASIRSSVLQFLTWQDWITWCQSCVFSFIHGISVREVVTPRVAIPFGPGSDPGSSEPLSSDLSDDTGYASETTDH